MRAGEQAVARTPEQLEVLARGRRRRRRRPRPRPDPRRRRRRARQRQRAAAEVAAPRAGRGTPGPITPTAVTATAPTSSSPATASSRAPFVPAARRARRLGSRRRRRDDAQGPRPHRRARGGGRASSRAPGRSGGSTSPTCRSRSPSASARLAAARQTGVLAVVSGDGLRDLYEGLGADVVDGGPTLTRRPTSCSPGSTRSRRGGARAAELAQRRAWPPSARPSSPSSPARVVGVHARQQAGPRRAGRARPATRPGPENARAARAGARRRFAPARSLRRRATTPQGRFVAGDAVGFVGERDRRLGRRRLDAARRRSRRSPSDAEIVTVIEGDGAPIASRRDHGRRSPDGVELELHSGRPAALVVAARGAMTPARRGRRGTRRRRALERGARDQGDGALRRTAAAHAVQRPRARRVSARVGGRAAARDHGAVPDATASAACSTPDRCESIRSTARRFRAARARARHFTGSSGLRRNLRWDALDTAYFAGYALWNYLTTPIMLTRGASRSRG